MNKDLNGPSTEERGRRPKAGWPARAIRDAEHLKKYARMVIIINDKANPIEIIENHDRFIANVICVLGPALVRDTLVPEALLIEVGVSRGRPYAQAERSKNYRSPNGERWFIKPRTPVRKVRDDECRPIFRLLQAAFEDVTRHIRSTWKPESREPWYVPVRRKKRGGEVKYIAYERGVQFSVHVRDEWLCDALLARSHKKYRHLLGKPPLGYVRLEIGRLRYLGHGKADGHGQQCVDFEFTFLRSARERLNV